MKSQLQTPAQDEPMTQATPPIFYHGTTEKFDHLDPRETVDGGIHFGTFLQAMMRSASKERTLISAYLRIDKVQRSKDLGGNWAVKIKAAKAAGKDGIVYLNRYEGMTTEIIERLQKEGLLDKLDGMSDSQFRLHVPEAQDSYIVFDSDQIEIIDIETITARPRPR